MSITYAFADLHGRFDLLIYALDAICRHAKAPSTVVALGDYVDRGPQSKQIINRLMGGLDGHTLVCLKGNHEEIMRLSCRVLENQNWWLQNGGGSTLVSYGHPNKGPVDLGYVLDTHLDWIENLPLMHVDDHRVFVHAGVDRNVPLEKQYELLDIHGNQKMIWKLYADKDEGGHGFLHVVHGHHQFEDGPILKKGRTDLDTFAWYTGRLVIGVFDDDIPGGPIELIEVKGDPAEGWD